MCDNQAELEQRLDSLIVRICAHIDAGFKAHEEHVDAILQRSGREWRCGAESLTTADANPQALVVESGSLEPSPSEYFAVRSCRQPTSISLGVTRPPSSFRQTDERNRQEILDKERELTNESFSPALIKNVSEIFHGKRTLLGFLVTPGPRRKKLLAFIESKAFSQFMAAVIFLNSIVIGIEVDQEAKYGGEEALSLKILGYAFTGVFLVELVMRIIADGRSFVYSKDVDGVLWNVFDSLVVVSSLIAIISGSMMQTDLTFLKSISTMRVFRLARLLRVLRIVRLFKVCGKLRIMIIAVGEAVKHSIWMMALLVLVTYLFSVFSVQLSSDVLHDSEGYQVDPNVVIYFGTVSRGMNTLFQSITGGVSWREPAEALSDVSWVAVFALNLYVIAVVLILLNVMTGLFCELAVSAALSDEEEVLKLKMNERDSYLNKLKVLFKELDDLGDESPEGLFTLSELELFLQDPRIEACFAALEIEPDDAWTLFKLIDKDAKGFVEFSSFLAGCKKCRGQAKAIDTHLLRYEIQWLMERVQAVSARVDGSRAEMLAIARDELFKSRQVATAAAKSSLTL